MKIWLNGQFVPESEAKIGAFDAGVQHAVGLFETMRAYHGKVFGLDAHIQRLISSAQTLGLSRDLQSEPLAQAVQQTVKENDLLDARIRLTITGGDLSLLSAASDGAPVEHRPSILIHATAPTAYPEAFLTEGVTVAIADSRTNPLDPLAGHKTLSYWGRLRELTLAASRGAAESLWLTVTNHLAGGSVSNILLIKDGTILSPFARGEEVDGALPAPVLPGTTRAEILKIAADEGIPVQRKMLSIDDALSADEIILTNSSWVVLPVIAVEAQSIGDGKVGPVTTQLYEKMLERIHAECAG
jgi:branched-chain amino acid aminotransferase